MGTLIASPLQLATPRDPNTTQPGTSTGELALIAALQARASAAAYVLPKIAPSLYWPTWSRYPLTREQRGVLMRAGGA